MHIGTNQFELTKPLNSQLLVGWSDLTAWLIGLGLINQPGWLMTLISINFRGWLVRLMEILASVYCRFQSISINSASELRHFGAL
jgi:hypothetical protein